MTIVAELVSKRVINFNTLRIGINTELEVHPVSGEKLVKDWTQHDRMRNMVEVGMYIALGEKREYCDCGIDVTDDDFYQSHGSCMHCYFG